MDTSIRKPFGLHAHCARVPAPLRAYLKTHSVVEARERGWERLTNGDLPNAAEAAGFEVFVTADKNLRYQQDLASRKIAIVVIGNAQWSILQFSVDLVVSAVDSATSSSYVEVVIPRS
jgi:hypothetical protein